MTLCLLGGTGFVGRHLCEHLHAHGIPALAVSRTPDETFLRGHAPSIRPLPLGDSNLWAELRQTSGIFYLASASRPATNWRTPEYEIDTNVTEATRFFDRLLDVNPSVRIVYASSGGTIYGRGHCSPIPEQTEPAPMASYALGKLLLEHILSFYSRTFGAAVTVLRIANPIGRWQFGGRHGLVSAAIEARQHGRTLTIYGDGNNVRDYFDADDLVEFMSELMTRPHMATGTYNIGSSQGRTELDIISLVSSLSNGPIAYDFAASRPYDLRYAVLDCHRARTNLGWHPRTGLEESIAKMLRQVGASAPR